MPCPEVKAQILNEVRDRVKQRNASPAKAESPQDQRTFSRPEDRGEDLSGLATAELATRLSASKDKADLRKAAKALGDRCTTSGLTLAAGEMKLVDDAVAGYLAMAKSQDANERTEAREQIERLWLAAVPTLLKSIGSKDGAVSELAVKSLILLWSPIC